MNQKTVLVQASSRSFGDTRIVSDHIVENFKIDFIDLKTLIINQYDYQEINNNDDFIPTMKQIISNYDKLIFITPIYWYTMSGILKAFLDRFTELLKTEKDLGRQLRGKHMGIISCSNDDDINYDFEYPFRLSSNYLGMHYSGFVHTWIKDNKMSEESLSRIENYFNSL